MEEDIGEKVNSKLFKAICRARIALIVFSRTYADSTWCMNELVEILECNKRFKKHDHLVVPIFYDVKAEDVSKLTSGSEFANGFQRLCKDTRDAEQIKKWGDALTEAKHLSGFDLRNDAGEDEGKFVEVIVQCLVEKISETQRLYFVKNAIGLEFLLDEVTSLIIKGQEEDTRIIGICGVEGIGKTMAAAFICEHIRHDFECFVFLDKIGEADRGGLLGLQKKLLHNLIKVKGLIMYDDIETNMKEINRNVCRKRILLVLDNVTRKEQIDYFGARERELLCPGSRILITTRDQNLLNDLNVDDKYVLRGLDRDNALRLFCLHAVKREEPQEGYKELSRDLVHYAGGHPSSLKWLGSFLNGKPKHQWDRTLWTLARNPYVDSLSRSFGSVGPHGGQGGDAFDDGAHAGVRQIRIRVGAVIDSITVDYDHEGCLVKSLEHGGHVHNIEKLVILNHPSEYIISISGHIDDYGGHDVVQSLKIRSNKKTYGPFGFERGRPFDISHLDGRIIGFHGKCNSHLHSIGAHFGPIPPKYPFDVVGPFGGDSDMDIWNDGKHTDVRQIIIGVDSAIKSISTLYDECGRPVGPFIHGPRKEDNTYTINLNYPREYLTSISGYTEEVSGLTTLQSLTIHTNMRDHGPIGTANNGRHFSFPYTGGKIIGFHGRCNGSGLESIGAFYERIPHFYPLRLFRHSGGVGKKSCDFDDIKGITVHFADSIKSIAFEAEDTESCGPQTKYSGNGGENIFKVKLTQGEYITSFAGYLKNTNGGGHRINSLAFQTNFRMLGPIGREEGVYFCSPSRAGKVTSFFWTCGDYLESIGAVVEPVCPFQQMGYGLTNGSYWDDGDSHVNVRKIIVESERSKGSSSSIRSITFQYEEEKQELWQSERHGGIDDNKFHIVKEVHTIKIDDPNEYLASISGYCGTAGITSLTFQTNKKTIGPIGDEEGWHFSFPAMGGKIVGFLGRSGEHLGAIGAHFKPILHLYPIKLIGPFGGLGGCAWNDGKFNGVREIEIISDYVIRSIRFVYDKRGEPAPSDWHGGYFEKDKCKVDRVILDFPREYLTSISGYKREDNSDIDNAIVQSLTFHSNRRGHGPFGKETGKYFWYPSTGSKIIGFYGTCDGTLKSIGVYAEPIPYMYPFKVIGLYGRSGGSPWDDGVHTDVRGIFMDSEGDGIYGISFDYDNNGSRVQGSNHGRGADRQVYTGVRLDFPKERLISITFWVEGNGNTTDAIIHNLIIHTTKNKYGPFGLAGFTKFALGMLTEVRIPPEPSGGRIVGFFGWAGSLLHSIGAHLEPY